mmetsp:Transcript_71567/g.209782  ORF Transcript_71567/g.209782 Transcript_71567/m.209782 type:complete len:213 (+) Transcript_71567:1333-1971(+)
MSLRTSESPASSCDCTCWTSLMRGVRPIGSLSRVWLLFCGKGSGSARLLLMAVITGERSTSGFCSRIALQTSARAASTDLVTSERSSAGLPSAMARSAAERSTSGWRSRTAWRTSLLAAPIAVVTPDTSTARLPSFMVTRRAALLSLMASRTGLRSTSGLCCRIASRTWDRSTCPFTLLIASITFEVSIAMVPFVRHWRTVDSFTSASDCVF